MSEDDRDKWVVGVKRTGNEGKGRGKPGVKQNHGMSRPPGLKEVQSETRLKEWRMISKELSECFPK